MQNTFANTLNEYMEQSNCTAKDLQKKTGLSAATISRYRSGERLPSKDDPQLKVIADVLYEAWTSSNNSTDASSIPEKFMSASVIYQNLQNTLQKSQPDFSATASAFDTLLKKLNVNIKSLANYLNYDVSYISRLRSNQRRPSDTNEFLHKVSTYIIDKHTSVSDQNALALLLGLSDNFSVLNRTEKIDALIHYLNTQDVKNSDDSTNQFLQTLEDFNLDTYIEAIHFNDIKVPTMPFQLTSHRHYWGLEALKEGELDFLKSTVFSKSMEPVIMCSDMPMEDMAEDKEFSKKWMFGLACILKKGLTIKMVHNLNRPFSELMLGLESWLPLYMTGQVEPYYQKQVDNKTYGHLNYCSGEVALTGACITNHHNEGHYYLTRKKDELSYLRQDCNHLIEKASSLMDIYTIANKNDFYSFQKEKAFRAKALSHRGANLPTYTLSDELLQKILEHNNLEEPEREQVISFIQKKKEDTLSFIQSGNLHDKITVLSQEEFERNKPCLCLTELFFSKDIIYTYEEYLEHLKLTKEYAAQQKNYTLTLENDYPFRNMHFTICDNEWVMISKNKYPTIHFVIYHPILRDAITNMITAYVE